MTAYHFSRLTGVSLLALCAAMTASTGPAWAQQPTALPPITVTTPKAQGATLEREAVTKPAAPAEPAAPQPAQTSQAKAPAAKKSAATPAPAAPAAPSAAPAAAAPQAAPSTDTASTNDTAGGIATTASGTSASVVTSADIERQQIRTAVEALRSLPGVTVSRSGSTGGLTQVRLRGAEGNHTLVIIDGIQANTTGDGEFDFSNLPAEDIERIEVIRGPMSGIYGTGAIGGVINITSKKGRGPATLTLRTEYGSFNTRELSARAQAGNEVGHLSASAQWRKTDGFNITERAVSPTGEMDGVRLGSFALNGGIRLAPNVTLDGTLRHINKRADRDGDDFFGTGVALDSDSKLKSSVWLAGLALKADTLDGRLTHEFKLDSNSTHNTDIGLDYGPPAYFLINQHDRVSASYAATYRLDTPAIWGRHAVTGQVQTERESFTPLSDYEDGVKRTRERLSLAGEWRATFADQLDIAAGGRRDDNSTFADVSTWRASTAWRIPGTGFRPHASVGTAVKQPTMFELFGQFPSGFVSNPLLQPETSRGFDAGLEVTLLAGKAVVDMTYFRTDVENSIRTRFSPTYTAINTAGTSTREGVEVASRFLLGPAISLGIAYTYTDARDAAGVREIRRPPHSGRVDLATSFDGGKGTFNVAAAYNGSTPERAACVGGLCPVGLLDLKAAMVVSVAAAYKIQPNIELFGRVENALDRQYQEIYGYNTPGIAAYAGVKLTFGPGAK